MTRALYHQINRVIRVTRDLPEPLPPLFPGGSPRRYHSVDLLHAVRVEIDADALIRQLEQKAARSKRGYSQIASGAIRVYAKEIKA
jgi:hypothetical protein